MRVAIFCKVFLTSLTLLTTVPALAQPPAETCGKDDSLGSGDMLPVALVAVTGTDDFEMTGAGCVEQSFDHVTCLTPAASCIVDAQCDAAILQDPTAEPIAGLQVGINAFEGTCTTSPASCLDSDVGTAGGAISGLALSAGTTYCFVCESDDMIDISLGIQTSGDCGALPVALESYTVD